ncbi:MAG: hypothetical protein ABR540_07045 [Acidimicrobiales bacterium]
MLGSAGPSAADVTALNGSAFGYFTNVGLFGGAASTHGPAPRVTLPAGGGNERDALPDGAKGQYGPAVVFGGIWPEPAPTGGPSGPITVSTQGTTGPGGSVTSSVDIVLHNPARPLAPGGIGPGPLIAEEVHSTCTADESGVGGSVTFVNGIVEQKYDKDTQLPIQSEIRPIPSNPPVNDEYFGTIDHVGDHFRIVLNEQITNADGSLTVNAAHMFLLGPIAIGEMVIGQSVCGATGGPSGAAPSASPSDGGSPSGSGSPAAPGSPSVPGSPSSTPDPSASTTSSSLAPGATTTRPAGQAAGSDLAARPVADSDDGLPLVIPALALAAGGAAAVIWARRRRLGQGGSPPFGGS